MKDTVGCNLKVNVTQLINCGITIEEYLLLRLIYTKQDTLLREYMSVRGSYKKGTFETLLSLGYLKDNEFDKKPDGETSYTFNLLEVTDKFLEDFPQNPEVKTIKVNILNSDDFIQEWFDLWPKGIKSGGYYLRTDLLGCSKKMTKFCNNYPEYTKERILEATKSYLDKYKIKGYDYCKLAPYFIEKDGISTLAGECENYSITIVNGFQDDI